MQQLKFSPKPDALHLELVDTVELSAVLVRPQVPLRMKLPKPVDAVCVLLPLLSVFLWSISLQHVSIKDMNELGLVSVLSPRIIFALIIINISFCLTLRQPRLRVPILLLHLALLIMMLYGIENLIEEAPRFAIVYRHAGYTEYIMRTSSVNPHLDAYFSWPGFFVLSAFLTQVAGYQSILSYAGWAPVFYNLIYFGPMYMIFTSATTDKRLVWLALWFFYLTNWIGQDYFSPQGLNFFLYLVIIAILLRWFKVQPKVLLRLKGRLPKHQGRISLLVCKLFEWLAEPDMLRSSTQPYQSILLLTILVFVFAMVVFSHPLTPFFLLASVTALVVFRRCKPTWLPVLMALMTGAWIYFMTQTFLAGHSSLVIGNFGQVSGNITSNVTKRVVQGDPQHTFIAEMRVVMTAFIWMLAFVGAVRRLRKGYHDITYILLAIAPIPLMVTQNYGGEMFLRVYLFTLPPIVFFAAAAFYSRHTLSVRGTPRLMMAAITGIIMVLLCGFLFTRYGNEQMDYMTYAEVDGVSHLYSIAPPNSLFLEGWNDTPWQYKDYEKYTCYSMTDVLPNAAATLNVNSVVQFIEKQRRSHIYVIFTRSEKAQAYSLSGLPPGSLDQLEIAMQHFGKFKLIYSNPDAQIFVFVNRAQEGRTYQYVLEKKG